MSTKYCAPLSIKSLYEGRLNKIKVQVINKWKELTFGTPDTKSIDMVFIDEEGDELHACIPENLIWKFGDAIKEGNMYYIVGLNLSKPKSKFRPAKGEKRGFFCHNTRITELQMHPASIIPQKFNFTEFEKINSNIQNVHLTGTVKEI
ncbi:hypothetical protein MKW92_043491 [Papaver armeniacum]|nr:hypothetical protein MKW92_043491 [Papaver armeniacum]